MSNKLRIFIVLFLVIPGLFFTVSCSSTKLKAPVIASQPLPEQTVFSDIDEAAIDEADIAEEIKLAQEAAIHQAKENFLNEDIYFSFDDSSLSINAQEKLISKAEWMQNNPDVHVIAEGHCDERGTSEYNIALGDRRAKRVNAFMVKFGIDQSRIRTISYGEERPVSLGSNEESWTQNRRAHFVIE